MIDVYLIEINSGVWDIIGPMGNSLTGETFNGTRIMAERWSNAYMSYDKNITVIYKETK